MQWTVALALLSVPLLGLGLERYLGDSVTLNATEECDNLLLIRRFKDDSSLTVATLVDGVWTPDERYEGRIEHLSKLSVTLTSVNYNDNGLYEFTCGNRVVTTVQLKVLITFDMSVTEGEKVNLPCYSFTADKTAKLIWEKDGELLLERDGESGHGTERRNRPIPVGLSPDWFTRGDMSLTLGRVQPEDEGVYVCYTVGPEKTRGEPGAVRVKITPQRTPDQITCAPQTGPPTPEATEEKMGTWTTIGVIVGLLVSLIVGFGCGWWVKSSRSNVSSGPGGGGSQTGIRMDQLDLEQQPFTGPQINGGPLRVNGNG